MSRAVQYFHPAMDIGVFLALCAMVCLLFSLPPAEKWIRARFRETPISCIIIAALLLGLGAFTVAQGIKVYQRKWGAASARGDTPCQNTGPSIANGEGNTATSGCNNK